MVAFTLWIIFLTFAVLVLTITCDNTTKKLAKLECFTTMKAHEHDSFIQYYKKEQVIKKRKARCKDCASLADIKGCMYCDKAEAPCIYVDVCPEGLDNKDSNN